jgi:hypothetical protein
MATKLYELKLGLSIKVEADDKREARRLAIELGEEVRRALPVGASIAAINGDSLTQI